MGREEPMELALGGLRLGSAQVWGAIRLVPLLRAVPIEGLRLHSVAYGGAAGVVNLGRPDTPKTSYTSWIPHGLVVDTAPDGSPMVTCGAHMGGKACQRPKLVQVHHRMHKPLSRHRLRLLPLHVALEGFLALHFGGPDLVHAAWSTRALRDGLSPREEPALAGMGIVGLAEALRVFEAHPTQCGVLIFVADAMASAFVAPSPEDYRALHASLLEDLYGPLLGHYGELAHGVQSHRVRLDAERIDSLESLGNHVIAARADWAAWTASLAQGLFPRVVRATLLRRVGDFRLHRFLTGTDVLAEQHIGECLTDPYGELAYLKTFRLTEAAVRRAHLLDHLARADWDPKVAAAALGCSIPQLYRQLLAAELGALLSHTALKEAQLR